jgi:hypothetical protein
MNKKVFSLAIISILSAFILVLVIVYATNTARINRLFGWDKGGKTDTQTTQETAQDNEDLSEDAFSVNQIGDDLDGFLLDEDFFDETEKIPAVVVIKKSTAQTAGDDASRMSGDLIGDDGISGENSDDAAEGGTKGTGMAVVGELTNPNPQLPAGYQDDATGASGYLSSVPQAPPGGFGQYIPADQTISGTPVGTP